MVELNLKKFEIRRTAGELIVVGSIVVEFQTAAYRWSVDTRGLRGARAWWGGTQHLWPSLNG